MRSVAVSCLCAYVSAPLLKIEYKCALRMRIRLTYGPTRRHDRTEWKCKLNHTVWGMPRSPWRETIRIAGIRIGVFVGDLFDAFFILHTRLHSFRQHNLVAGGVFVGAQHPRRLRAIINRRVNARCVCALLAAIHGAFTSGISQSI